MINKGYVFEDRVAELFAALGKRKVKQNIILERNKVKAQFDITYGFLRTHYIECKYRSTKSVTFNEVTTFAGKLQLFHIPLRRGIIITNSVYEHRAEVYAKQHHLTLIDGEQLDVLYYSSISFFKRPFVSTQFKI